MIDREHALPLSRQCRILEICRSSYYYPAVPVDQRDGDLMRLIDEIHLKYPFYGSRKVRDELWDRGHKVGRGHVRTLMRKMGIEALYQKPRLSEPHPGHKVYPYLLRGLEITRANHVWAADISYIPMARGFCYLVAIMDWASRRVLSWRLSNTLDTSFCTEALEEALQSYGTPEIFNTDQGSQFTSEAFTGILKPPMASGSAWTAKAAGWTMFSSKGCGRASSTKRCISRRISSIAEARQELGVYFNFYNQRRRHQGLDNRTPDEVY